jgi:hypothetical protein
MIKNFSFTTALLLVAGIATASPAIDAVNNQWTVSIGKQRMDYHEMDNYNDVPTKYLDSETGSQPWISASFSKQFNIGRFENFFLKGSLAYATGHTRYNGYLYDSMTDTYTPYRSTTDTTTFDTEIKVGKGFVLGNYVQLTPYISYAFHSWNRDMEANDSAHGYVETYYHGAYNVGTLAQFAFTPKLVGHVDSSIGRTSGARMYADDTDDEYKLGSRTIFTVDVGLTYLVGKKWSVNGGYRLNKFSYGESPVVNGYYEPESKTKLQTIYLGVGRQF